MYEWPVSVKNVNILKYFNILYSVQAFSQKGIRVSCGRPILGENDKNCTKALTKCYEGTCLQDAYFSNSD